ncbi:uncharacterized protein LOC129371987 isoform X2 [Poeciliopsis prolifica]|uniref:uncharacterized protein LOC129371987 isoform X2 n=1 Tax=Poeciliopsis prolifica TaxID=188132 RepID=UPI00241321ED|nr:uncharacterized protein LOC129371987 isoform X2 [Poeciliopsis prolifica]
MTEPPRGLIYLHIIYLWTGGVEGTVLASLAPPVHLSGERLGLTLLVCVVNDFRRGHLEISWRSASDEEYTNITPYNGAVTRKHRGHSAVAMITVVTSNWPSYSCSVRRKKHSKAKKRHRITSAGEDEMCDSDEETEDVTVRTNAVVVLYMRLLLMKIIVFDALMTIYLVVKWMKRKKISTKIFPIFFRYVEKKNFGYRT